MNWHIFFTSFIITLLIADIAITVHKYRARHTHHYIPRGVNQMTTTQGKLTKRIYTVILMVCSDCGYCTSIEVDGQWTLEQVRDMKMDELKA